MLMQIRNVIFAWFVCSFFLVGCDIDYKTEMDLASIRRGDYPIDVAQNVGKPDAVKYGEDKKKVYWFYYLRKRVYSVTFRLQDGSYRTSRPKARLRGPGEMYHMNFGPPFDYGYD